MRPGRFWWLKPSRVKPVPHESGYLAGFLLYYPAAGGQPIPFRTDEIVWFRYPNPLDEFSAMSPLAVAPLAVDMVGDDEVEPVPVHAGAADGWCGHAGERQGQLSTDGQAEDLASMLDKRLRVWTRRIAWVVLRFEAQFQKMQISPKDAEQLVEGLNLTLRQIANV